MRFGFIKNPGTIPENLKSNKHHQIGF